MKKAEAFRVLNPGVGATLQDRGRRGWRKFGVPASGAMDEHAAFWANRLLDNPAEAPLLELVLQGARLSILIETWVALTGAAAGTGPDRWRVVKLKAGEEIEFGHPRSGVWTYLAIESGFAADLCLGSASVYARGAIGHPLKAGDLLIRSGARSFELPQGIGGRSVPAMERREYSHLPPLRVWPGPQVEQFSEDARAQFFSQEWTVTPQSDRTGYRLNGPGLVSNRAQILSEPVRVGTIQVPEDGQPIVTMRDGPTVGGYPKLGLLEPGDVSWLAQCQPGQAVRFVHAT